VCLSVCENINCLLRILSDHCQHAGEGGITHQREPQGSAVWVEPLEAGRRPTALHQVLTLQLRDGRLNSGLHPSQLPAQLIDAGESPSPPLQLTQQAFHAAEASSAATAQVQPTPSSSAETSASAGFQLDPIVAKQVVFNLVEQLQQGGLGVVNKLLALKFQIPPLLVALCPRHT